VNCPKCATPLPQDSRFCSSCGADVSGDSPERTQPGDDDEGLARQLQAEVVGDFTIERLLGRGGMAAVFLARDEHLGRHVAIKVLPPELTYGSRLIDRFRREARTAATLDHPHIIPIHRVSTGGKLFWYAMKYVEGDSLADVLQRDGRLSLDRTVDVIEQTALALAHAHGRGVIHRDIKPANIILDGTGWVTVTDFGIAKALGSESLTSSGAMIGTPYYMSPEQCSGTEVSPAADQYSLGIVAYEMLTGRVPFHGTSVVDIVQKHCAEPVPPLADSRPDMPAAVAAVVERALAKRAEQRFAGVAEFSAMLKGAAAGQLVVPAAAPASPEPRRRSVTADLSQVPSRPRAAAQPKRASRRAIVLGVVAVLAGGGALASVLLPRMGSRPDAEAPGPVGGPAQQTVGLDTSPHDANRVDTASAPTAQPAPRDTLAAVATPGTAAASHQPAMLTLRGVPRDASVGVNGSVVRGSPVRLAPGVRQVVVVIAPGYEPWSEAITPRAGDALVRDLQLRPVPQRAESVAQSSPPAVQAPTPAQEQPAAPVAAAPTPRAADTVAAPATARITVGSTPLAAMTINGRPVSSNPVSDYEVPAGRVQLRFQVTDSSGVWFMDTSVVVTSGRRNLGRIRLVRRP